MQEYENLINQIKQALETMNNLNTEEKINFIHSNYNIFFDFKLSLNTILYLFQFKEPNNPTQNKLSTDVKNICIQLLGLQNVFDYDSDEMSFFKYFKYEILEALSKNASYYVGTLQYQGTLAKTPGAIQYLQDRNEYIAAIENFLPYETDTMTLSAANSFKNDHYEENMLGHSLMQLSTNFKELSKEDVLNLISMIENSSFVSNLINNVNSRNFSEKNLIYQYTRTIIKLKTIFTPKELKNDKFVELFWNGKIQDSSLIKQICENLSIGSFDNLLSDIIDTEDYEFFPELSNYLSSKGFNARNISIIVVELISKNISTHVIADLLAKIGNPNTVEDFIKSEHYTDFPWIAEGNIFEKLKEIEHSKIENAYSPFLSCNYYLEKIPTFNANRDIDGHFLQNLYVLLNTSFFTQEEKNKLLASLDQHGLTNQFMETDPIVFNPTDDIATTYEKAICSYLSGQTMPVDISISLLSSFISKSTPKTDTHFELYEKVIESAIQSIIQNYLLKDGIDIENKVFFGNGHMHNSGYYMHSKKCIWIDHNLVDQFISSPNLRKKVELLITAFHEMRHAKQHLNIEKGKIDYQTYNFIKEEILSDYDEDFYTANYQSIFTESDARKESIIDTLEFLKKVNPQLINRVKLSLETDFIQESTDYMMYNTSEKNMSFADKNFKMDISDYIASLIEKNPEILTKWPILSIEYTESGSKKSIETMLTEYENSIAQTPEKISELYPIYYGLISRDMSNTTIDNSDLHKRINDFLSQHQQFINLEDMQAYYKKIPAKNIHATYERLFSITRTTEGLTNNTDTKGGPNVDDNTTR